MMVHVIGTQGTDTPGSTTESLVGNTASSLHRQSDENGRDSAFFIFGDISIKLEGTFLLRFVLYEKRELEVFPITTVDSTPFAVVDGKAYSNYALTMDVTALNRALWKQGVRLKVRSVPKKRSPRNAAKEDENHHPYKRPRGLKKGPTSPKSQALKQEKEDEGSMSLHGPQEHTHLPLNSTASLPHMTIETVMEQQERGAHSNQLHDMLDWQPPSTGFMTIQPHVIPGQEHWNPPDQHVHSYSQFGNTTYSLPSVVQTSQSLLLGQASAHENELRELLNTRRPSIDHRSRYTAQYLERHGFRSIFDLQGDAVQLPPIHDIQSLEEGTSQAARGNAMPSEPSATDNLGLTPKAHDPRPKLQDLHQHPSAEQNLSAGSMIEPEPDPPVSDGMKATSAPDILL